jgi:hypothetical protein
MYQRNEPDLSVEQLPLWTRVLLTLPTFYSASFRKNTNTGNKEGKRTHMSVVQGPHATFQQNLLLHTHLEDVHHERKHWAKAAPEEQEGTEQAIDCAYLDCVQDDEQKVAKQQDK